METQVILFCVRENWHYIEETMPEKLKLYITADEILLKAARNFVGQCDPSEVWFLSGKSHGIMKTCVCGNHDQFLVFMAWKMTWFGISRLVWEVILWVDE